MREGLSLTGGRQPGKTGEGLVRTHGDGHGKGIGPLSIPAGMMYPADALAGKTDRSMKMKGRYLAVVVFAAGISACASNSEVQKFGKDTYTIAVRGSEAEGAAEAKRQALSDARSYCASLDKSFAFLRTFTPVSYFSDEGEKNYVLDFRCLDESDPEYKNLVIEKTPEVSPETDSQ
jgi:hypothetical protein